MFTICALVMLTFPYGKIVNNMSLTARILTRRDAAGPDRNRLRYVAY